MPSENQRIESPRLWISAWTIAWVTATPLFHIHLPDIFDRKADQIGVVHTVLSPDLPGEFSRFSNAKPEDPVPHFSHWVFNSPELGFVLSESSEDREKGKPILLGIRGSLPDQPSMPSSAFESLARHQQHLVFALPQGPRAPPL